MPYPTAPDIDFSYTAFQQAQGNNQFPGTQLDNDLANLERSCDEIVDFIAGAFRSDGRLANNSVGKEQLAQDVLIGFPAPRAWATATVYPLDATVFQNNRLYIALQAHTSGVFNTDLAAGRWQQIVDLTSVVVPDESITAVKLSTADLPAIRSKLSIIPAVPLAGGTMTGDLTISKANPFIALNKAAGAQIANLRGLTNGLLRWEMFLGDTSPEAGSNAGSNFSLNRYSDSGILIETSFNINRASGVASFAQRPLHAGSQIHTFADSTPYTRTLLAQPTAGDARSWLGVPPTTSFTQSLLTAADAAAARTTLDTPLRPNSFIWSVATTADNQAAVIPAGGTWAYAVLAFNTSNGTLIFVNDGGVTLGGTTVGVATAGRRWVLLVWRVA